MASDRLDVWTRIAEITTAVVVVVSLVYIAVELDQNTRATHTASWEAVNSILTELDMTEATELGSVVAKIEADPDSVTFDEYWVFSRFAQARLGALEYAFLGIQTDTLSEYHWGAVSGYLEHTICKPGYKRVWAEIGASVYHPDFQLHINEILDKC